MKRHVRPRSAQRRIPCKFLTSIQISKKSKQQGDIHRAEVQRSGKDRRRFSLFFSPITNVSTQIKSTLCCKQDGKSSLLNHQGAADKTSQKQPRSDPAQNFMGEKAECEESLARIQASEVRKQRLVITGGNAHPSSRLCVSGWSNFLDGNRFRIIDHPVTVKADFKGDLEVFNNRLFLGAKKVAAHGKYTAVTSKRAIETILEKFKGGFILPVK